MDGDDEGDAHYYKERQPNSHRVNQHQIEAQEECPKQHQRHCTHDYEAGSASKTEIDVTNGGLANGPAEHESADEGIAIEQQRKEADGVKKRRSKERN